MFMKGPAGRFERGFTIIELMIVVVVIAILTAIAVPNLRSFVVNQRVKTASFDLYSALLFARSEAVKRPAGVVRITPSDAANWATGWTVQFIPVGATAEPPIVTLRRQDAIQDIVITANPANNFLEFGRDARPDAKLVFTLNAIGFSSISGRCVTTGLTGMTATKIKPADDCD